MTQEWFKLLKKLKEVEKEAWFKGAFTTESFEGTIQLNSEAIGKAYVLDRLVNMEWEEFEGDIHEPI